LSNANALLGQDIYKEGAGSAVPSWREDGLVLLVPLYTAGAAFERELFCKSLDTVGEMLNIVLGLFL
jgi:hypothetical protein